MCKPRQAPLTSIKVEKNEMPPKKITIKEFDFGFLRPEHFVSREGDHMKCHNCGFDTWNGNELFMLEDDVWVEAVTGHTPCDPIRFLCIGCVEEGLGRELEASDFVPDHCIHMKDSIAMSDRLKDRLSRGPGVEDLQQYYDIQLEGLKRRVEEQEMVKV